MIRAVATGPFTLETARTTFRDLIAAVGQHKARRVLFDARAVTGEPTVMERFQYGEFCAQEVLNLVESEKVLPRFAYVMYMPVLDYGRFGETVAINRGMRVKATDNLKEALEWLGLPDT